MAERHGDDEPLQRRQDEHRSLDGGQDEDGWRDRRVAEEEGRAGDGEREDGDRAATEGKADHRVEREDVTLAAVVHAEEEEDVLERDDHDQRSDEERQEPQDLGRADRTDDERREGLLAPERRRVVAFVTEVVRYVQLGLAREGVLAAIPVKRDGGSDVCHDGEADARRSRRFRRHPRIDPLSRLDHDRQSKAPLQWSARYFHGHGSGMTRLARKTAAISRLLNGCPLRNLDHWSDCAHDMIVTWAIPPVATGGATAGAERIARVPGPPETDQAGMTLKARLLVA